MSLKSQRIVFLLAVFFLNTVQFQGFKSDILAFKRQDLIVFPPSNAILFVGVHHLQNGRMFHRIFPIIRLSIEVSEVQPCWMLSVWKRYYFSI